MPTEHNPLIRFVEWLDAAKAHPAISEPTAMTLATANRLGRPSARIVLLKSVREEGFSFYTNLNSRKSRELKENPYASLCFYWMPLDRQIRIEGTLSAVRDADADAYFASRPRARQIGAWASLQSEPLDSRETLDRRVQELEQQYEGREIPRPPHWSGWILSPESIEFWEQHLARLHDRSIYQRQADGSWRYQLLYP